MANVKEFISKLAKAAGMNPETNEALKTLVENEALAKIEVDSTVDNFICNTLMNEDAAKNNAKLADHFRAVMLNGIDKKLIDFSKDLELPDEVIAEITGIDKTVGKIDALKGKLRDLFEKKGTSKQSKEQFEIERKALNDRIAELTAEIPKIREEGKKQLSSHLKERDLTQLLQSYTYGLDIPKEAIIATAKTLLQNELSANKWQLDYNIDNTQNPFRLLTDANLEAYKDNQPVTLKSLVDKVLSDNKLLKVSDPTPPATPPNTRQIIPPSNQPNVAAITNSYEAQIAELSK